MLRIGGFTMVGRSMDWTIAQARRENRPRFFPRSGPPSSQKGEHFAAGATMTLRPLLLLPLLAIAACETQKKPLNGYDSPPPGILLNNDGIGGALLLWALFDLPPEQQNFEPLLNGQGAVILSSTVEGFYNYDYELFPLKGWTGGFLTGLGWFPAGTYVVELVDETTGQSWGQSAPLSVPPSDPSGQLPTVILTHFDDQVGSWNIDPATQDADPATDEITVTNLIQEDVVVQRCLMTAAGPTSCTSVGTVSPGADLSTVETLATSSSADYQALFVQLASDASQSYERDLVQGSGAFGASCQIERILVNGERPLPPGSTLTGYSAFALSSCYGTAPGPPPAHGP
jgi:hypothetical protein